MKIKKGVRIFGMSPEIQACFGVVERVWRELDNYDNCVLTSGTEGQHSRGSEHYKGDAADFRVWGWNDAERAEAAERLRGYLSEEFEVFDEGNHIHVGFDPSAGLNMESTDNT